MAKRFGVLRDWIYRMLDRLLLPEKARRKTQICFRIDEELYQELKQICDETGLTLSQLIELRLKGYEVVNRKGL